MPFHSMLTFKKHLSRNIDKIAYRLALMNYHTAKAYHHYKLAHIESGYRGSPILVYQMGKVGSRSVAHSLKTAIKDRPIYHFHILRPTRVSQYEQWRKKSFPRFLGAIKYVWLCQYIYNKSQRRLKSNGKKWKIITLVRDPIARNISDFFQNIELKSTGTDGQYIIRGVGSEVTQVYDFEISIVNNDPGKLIDIFLEKYPHHSPLKWFDSEFRDILGVDIFTENFPKTKGYKIYKEKFAEILVIRLENLQECAHEALRDFLKIENFTLINKNVSREKDYATIYQAFKDSIVFPERYLVKMYKSKFARHFYSESEIEKFRAKWS